jgi:hypothetical protein
MSREVFDRGCNSRSRSAKTNRLADSIHVVRQCPNSLPQAGQWIENTEHIEQITSKYRPPHVYNSKSSLEPRNTMTYNSLSRLSKAITQVIDEPPIERVKRVIAGYKNTAIGRSTSDGKKEIDGHKTAKYRDRSLSLGALSDSTLVSWRALR